MPSATTKRPAAKKAPADDLAFDLPPFPGFDKAGFKFLKELKENNVREWFTPERKELYQNTLLEPMRLLLGELAMRFREEKLSYSPNPKGGIFRIYRDTRFSKDKTPFKTHVGAMVPYANEAKEGVGNYIHIDPGHCFYGGGAYFIESPGLRRLRTTISEDPDRLRRILKKLEKEFGGLQGEKLKRPPAGFDKEDPALDLLLYTQMWMSKQFPDKLATSRELVDWIVIRTRELNDFNTYLYEAIKGA
jgi:uncharacterized protein (TIGR02453 family)